MSGKPEDAKKACQDSIVVLKKDIALICLILNCLPFTAGIGTCISACLGPKFNMIALLFGVI